jgi:hypothetical protein
MKKLMRKIWWHIEDYVTDPLWWMMGILVLLGVATLILLGVMIYTLCTGQAELTNSHGLANWNLYWTLYNMRQIIG